MAASSSNRSVFFREEMFPDETQEHRAVEVTTSMMNVTGKKRMCPTSENFRAGNIAQCYEAWAELTTDKWILHMVKPGYKIEFETLPSLHLKQKEPSKLDDALQEFVIQGIVEQCNGNHNAYYSTCLQPPNMMVLYGLFSI